MWQFRNNGSVRKFKEISSRFFCINSRLATFMTVIAQATETFQQCKTILCQTLAISFDELQIILKLEKVFMAKVFENGEQGVDYINWCNTHHDNFVLNTGRSIKSRLFSLHLGRCKHICDIKKLKEESYLNGDKIKVCSTNLKDLKEWTGMNRQNFRGHFKECKSCNPVSTH